MENGGNILGAVRLQLDNDVVRPQDFRDECSLDRLEPLEDGLSLGRSYGEQLPAGN